MGVKSMLRQNLILLPGWRTKRKIVVIESDDWGTIRMTDAAVLAALSKKNPSIEKDPLSCLDSMETNEDLMALFDCLRSVKDSKGKNAVFTANSIVANPDFEKIAASNFEQYHFETFTTTLKRYPRREKVFRLINEGMAEGIYRPQFHGREHLNIKQWLRALQNGHHELLEAFKYHVFGIALSNRNTKRRNMMSALDMDDLNEMAEKKKIVKEGMQIFEKIFGYRSSSFIATTYVWHPGIEAELNDGGVRFIQGLPYQFIPDPGGKWFKRKFHYTGQRNKHRQLYLVRNAFFEPSLTPGIDVVGECMKRITQAFTWNKPAIICAHRLNFIGSIEEKNRTNNLKLFRGLLFKIVSCWPDVEFMSTDQLGALMCGSNKEQST